MAVRIVIVMDWDTNTWKCKAETLSSNFLHRVTADGNGPLGCLEALRVAWCNADTHQATISALDEGDDD